MRRGRQSFPVKNLNEPPTPRGRWMPPSSPRHEGTGMLHGGDKPAPVPLPLPRPTCTQTWQSSRLPSTDESVGIYFWRWEIFHLDKTTAVFPVSVHKRNNRQMCIEWIYLHRILPYKEQWKLESVLLPNHSRVFGFFFFFWKILCIGEFLNTARQQAASCYENSQQPDIQQSDIPPAPNVINRADNDLPQ